MRRDEGAGERDGRPEEDAGRHQPLAVDAVAEVAEEGREEHVEDDERRLQKAGVGVRQRVVLLHVLQDACGTTRQTHSTQRPRCTHRTHTRTRFNIIRARPSS